MNLEITEWAKLFLCSHFFVLIAGIVALNIVANRFKSGIAFGVVCLTALITSFIAFQAISHGSLEIKLWGGQFMDMIPFRIDGLSAWFILIINFVSITGCFYGTGYLKPYQSANNVLNLHWSLFLIFQASMTWVCMIQNSMAFLIAWELMSVSSMLLVIFEHTNTKVIKAGINYLVQMHISVVLLTLAFLWVYFKTGSFDFRSIGAFFNTNTNVWLFLLFFTGFGIKAGFIGLHTWLPHAHPAAPSHVSGVMSGVIVKMGIYGIFRIISFLKTDFTLIGEILITISILTGLIGIMKASVNRDFKRMLAYCTIENIGIIGLGLGLGLTGIGTHQPVLAFLGFAGAMLHILNHSLFKSLLFFSAGSVYQQTHTRDMEKLGGLVKKMPQTAIIFLIGAVAITGIPPFNGFISEFLIYSGLISGMSSQSNAVITLMILSFASLSLIGGISILTFTKTFGILFLGSPRTTLDHTPHEVSFKMRLPLYITIFGMLCVAFLPGFLLQTVEIILKDIFPVLSPVNINTFKFIDILQNISLYSFAFIILVTAIYFIKRVAVKNREISESSTWGCGYVAPTPKIQYTGKSFSKPLAKLFYFILPEKKEYKELNNNEIFPKDKKYTSFYPDFFEDKIINPITHNLIKLINLFKFIQNGKVQTYILYGILFILLLIAGTVFQALN